MIRRLVIPVGLVLALVACEREQAEPPAAPPPVAPTTPATPPDSGAQPAPSEGERATVEPPFVGVWAADAGWCGNQTGAERPIRVTASRFEGYENSCAIRSVVRNPDGWDATLACDGEGQRSTERVRMTVRGDEMVLLYKDRENASVTFTRCPAPPPPLRPPGADG